MQSIWDTLEKPFFILAPMENVTDTVYRQIVASCASPDLFFTEFTSVDGYLSAGEKTVGQRLLFTETEKPLIAQIWGTKPEHFFKAAQKISRLPFAGIDINMGCPDKNITRQGGCSALIKTPSLAVEIIQATKEGAGILPVSVKTRIGFQTIDTENWIGTLLTSHIAALTIHGRTAKEMSKVPVHKEEIGKAVQLRNSMHVPTYIIANGDIKNRQEGMDFIKQYHVDGIMIGRGIFLDLWTFEKEKKQHTVAEYLQKLLQHTDLFESTWGSTKNFFILKKFYKAYIKDFDGASELRAELMAVNSSQEVKDIISAFLAETSKATLTAA